MNKQANGVSLLLLSFLVLLLRYEFKEVLYFHSGIDRVIPEKYDDC